MSPTPDSTLDDPKQMIAELQQQLTERTAELNEALAQQAATAEVLQVINSSPGDLAPVFDAMLEKAMSLCNGAFGELTVYDGKEFHTAAVRNLPVAFAAHLHGGPRTFGPGTGPMRMLAGEHVLFHLDLKDEDVYRSGDPNRRALVDFGGARSALQVALLKEETFLGFITVFRQEVRPFSEKQAAILKSFAAQAVIAIENARLITETSGALEQQTATAEVLGVINSSPGDLVPVFDATLEKAHSLCGAEFGALLTYDGEFVRLAAERNLPPAWAELVRGPWCPRHDHPVSRMLGGERLFQIDDMAELAQTSDDPMVQAAVELGGIRTLLLIPLRKDDAFVGYITAYRQEIRRFTEKRIALLQNFAAQGHRDGKRARVTGSWCSLTIRFRSPTQPNAPSGWRWRCVRWPAR